MYIKSKPKLIVQLLSHMYYYTQRKTPSGRVKEGGAGRGGRVVNLFKQQNHKVGGSNKRKLKGPVHTLLLASGFRQRTSEGNSIVLAASRRKNN